MAHIKYRYFAKLARAEGYTEVAAHFEHTADQELLHAWGHLELLVGKPDTRKCLEIAIEGETHEFTYMYPGFAAAAKAEGNIEAAKEAEQQIAEAAIAAAEAGAAILHLHARDPADGRPSQDPELFVPFLEQIKARTQAVVNITTGGSPHMSVQERMRPVLAFAPELASLNMGSMNFGLFPMLNRFSDFKHDWEEDYLRGSDDRVFKNTFKDIEMILTRCADNGTRFEVECYDIGHLYTCKHFVDRGLIKAPLFIQSVFGILGGIGQHPEDVMHMKRTADRLFGDNYQWSVLGAGAKQMQIAAQAAMMGGNVRVGLEDSLWLGRGKLAESNAAQVRAAVQMIQELGMDVATPDEARELLALKGGHDVNF